MDLGPGLSLDGSRWVTRAHAGSSIPLERGDTVTDTRLRFERECIREGQDASSLEHLTVTNLALLERECLSCTWETSRTIDSVLP